MLENLILIGHLIAAVAIIGLILLQQGKGAEMGASFGGGASQTLFGSSGSGNFFAKFTALLAAVFFATSLTLAVVAKKSTVIEDDLGLGTLEEVDVPIIEELSDSELPSLGEASEGLKDELPSIDEVQEAAGEVIEHAEKALEEELPSIPEADEK